MLQRFVKESPVLSAAFALFAMLFGSGNIVFPLGLGTTFGSMALYALIGFFATAVLVPLLGIIAMALFEGDYRSFLGRIGRFPSKLLILLCMGLIGPFCIIPRCIALSHSALQWLMPDLSLLFFSIFSALFIFVLTVRRSRLLEILGKYLGPLKLALLGLIIIRGLFAAPHMISCSVPALSALTQGALDGYGTLDLVGAIFFSSIVFGGLKRQERVKTVCKAGFLAAFLLGLVYSGFILVAARQSHFCQHIEPTQLLSSLAFLLLGHSGGILATLTLVVACLTTALALTSVFADYVSSLAEQSIDYQKSLLITLIVSIIFANYGFKGIMSLMGPLIELCYPALILLTCANIVYKLGKFDFAQPLFYGGILLSLIHIF